MYKEGGEKLIGNDRFEGYSIDLIDEIAKTLGFKYEFRLTPDGRYGSYNPNTKKWDGLVKQLLERVMKCKLVKRGEHFNNIRTYRKLIWQFVI